MTDLSRYCGWPLRGSGDFNPSFSTESHPASPGRRVLATARDGTCYGLLSAFSDASRVPRQMEPSIRACGMSSETLQVLLILQRRSRLPPDKIISISIFVFLGTRLPRNLASYLLGAGSRAAPNHRAGDT